MTRQMRTLHRYIGFFMIGMTLVYALSGIVLTYRNTDVFKTEKTTLQTIERNLSDEKLITFLPRGAKITSQNDDLVHFNPNGTYDRSTGEIKYTSMQVVIPFDKLSSLHKSNGNSPFHWVNIFSAIAFIFLGISGIFMFPLKSKMFKKGIFITLLGVILTTIILFLV